MWTYLLKRLLLIPVTLFGVTLINFVVIHMAPGSPIDKGMGEQQGFNPGDIQQDTNELRKQFHLDKPVLFNRRGFQDHSGATRRLVRIIVDYEVPELRQAVAALAAGKRDPEVFTSLERLGETWEIANLDDTARGALEEGPQALEVFHRSSVKTIYATAIQRLRDLERWAVPTLVELLDSSRREERILAVSFLALATDRYDRKAREGMSEEKVGALVLEWKDWWENNRGDYRYSFFRKLGIFFGKTQYALYLWDLLRLDLGESTESGQREPVIERIWRHLRVSLVLMIISTILVYTIAVPIGIFSAVQHRTHSEQIISLLLFVLYSLPSFVGAIILRHLFATGHPWDFLPVDGLTSPERDWMWMNSLERIADYAWHLVLPVACLTYGGLASLSRYARTGMLEVIRQDYMRTARAKGLSERVVILKHGLRNALIPLITLFANLLPVMIGGSVILETIFSIKGMGHLSVHSIFKNDYTTLMGVMVITALLVQLGILLSDLLYAVADPRITYD